MSATPKVSVIVCTYNQEQTIARSLESILAQKTDFPYEIILADDCSSDSTPEICADYARRYPDIIRPFLNKRNKGVVDNYFDCVEACRGKYIADLAGDDMWTDPQKLVRQAKIMDNDSDIVLCHAAWRPVYPDGTFADHSPWSIPDTASIAPAGSQTMTLLRHEKDKYFIHLCSAMYRRETLTGFMQRYPRLFRDKTLTCEDLQINVLMSQAGKIAYTPDVVLHYTVGSPSVSSSENPVKTIRFYSGVIALTSRLAEALDIDNSQLKGCYAEVMQFIIMQYFVSHSVEGRQLVSDLLHRESIPLSLKNRITLLLSANRAVWRLTAAIRRLLKD